MIIDSLEKSLFNLYLTIKYKNLYTHIYEVCTYMSVYKSIYMQFVLSLTLWIFFSSVYVSYSCLMTFECNNLFNFFLWT